MTFMDFIEKKGEILKFIPVKRYNSPYDADLHEY